MDYKAEYLRKQKDIELIERQLDVYLTDMSVDTENVHPINETNPLYWKRMLLSFHNSVGQRMSEIGLDPSQYGIKY